MKNESKSDPLREQFSSSLIKFINENGLNQKELSGILGINPSLLSSYINRKALPPLETLVRICQALGCSADSLLMADQKSEEKKHQGIEWIERQQERFPPQQRDEIVRGIELFGALVVEGVKASDLMKGMNQDSPVQWQDFTGSYEVALRSGALRITNVPRDSQLEAAIKQKYGLKFVMVAKLPKSQGDYMDAAIIGAEFISFLACREILDRLNFSGAAFGIGQGYTIMRMMEQSTCSSVRFGGTDWIPLVAESITGAGFSRHTSRFIAQAMSKRHPGSRLLSLPYIKPDRRTAVLADTPHADDPREQAASGAIERLREARAMFVTVNSLNLTEAPFLGDFPPDAEDDLRLIIKEEKLGDRAVALFEDVVLDAEGEAIDNARLQAYIDKTIFAVGTQKLERVKSFGNSYLLAAGDHKAKPVLAVLRMKDRIVDSIIVDSIIGEYLANQA